MNIKDIDFQKLTSDELKQLRLSTAIELEDRGMPIHAASEEVEASIAQLKRLSEPKPESPQAIASKSEAEIQLRAEKMLAATFNQRVVI